MKKRSFIQYGFGPIGKKVASYALERGFELEAVIDLDPNKIGKSINEFLNNGCDVVISGDPNKALKQSSANVVFLTTVSSLNAIYPEIARISHYGKNIVSTCEELAYPWKRQPELSDKIDKITKKYGVSVIGTGVNPGFAMDALPIFLTSVCQDVESIKIERYQDASIRRLPFQQKIGAGCSKKEFEKLVDEKKIKHVGFPESVDMIADALGWKLDNIEERVNPVIADKEVKSKFLTVKKGEVCGVNQVCKGYFNGKELITLELQAYLGHKDPHDAVIIKGNPDINSIVKGGFNGDIATCAMAVNCAKQIVGAKKGLRTMLDIGLVSFYK